MKRTNVIMISVMAIVLFCGCQEKQTSVGFLSDYSKLDRVSDQTLRYLPNNALSGYSSFIIDPVTVRFYSTSTNAKVNRQDKEHLAQFMYTEVRRALYGKYKFAWKPGPGVARVRIAITDVKESKTLQNLMPMTKMAGTGLGGASIEAEVVDSQTGKQIAAILETQTGNRLSLDGLSKWGDTEAVMKDWATRLRQRLDEAN